MVYLTVFFKKSTGEILKTEKNKYVGCRVALRRFLGVDDVSDIGVTYVPGVDELAGEGWRVVFNRCNGKVAVVKDDVNICEDAALAASLKYIENVDVVHVKFEGGMGDYLLQCDAVSVAAKKWQGKEFVCHVDPTRVGLLEMVEMPENVSFTSDGCKEKSYLNMSKITGMDYFHPPIGKAYSYGVLLGYRELIPFVRIIIPGHLVTWALEERARILQGGKYLVGVHWQSGSPPNAKSWFAERVVELAEVLGDRGCRVIVFGGFGEKFDCECSAIFQAQGMFSWEQVAALVGVCDCLVCIDSAIMHIGLRLGKRVVSLWGPTSKEWILPSFADHVAIEGRCPKRPCGRYECIGRPCMSQISVDMLGRKVLETLCGDDGCG